VQLILGEHSLLCTVHFHTVPFVLKRPHPRPTTGWGHPLPSAGLCLLLLQFDVQYSLVLVPNHWDPHFHPGELNQLKINKKTRSYFSEFCSGYKYPTHSCTHWQNIAYICESLEQEKNVLNDSSEEEIWAFLQNIRLFEFLTIARNVFIYNIKRCR
jgi:hypothetical protein